MRPPAGRPVADDHTRRLAAFASALTLADVPRAVVDHARLCLLDTIGCGLFGSTLPWSRILAACVGELEPAGPSRLWGLASTASPASAALVNGTMVHGFELDDLHRRAIVHPGAVVPTAALALAEFLGRCSGARFLTAVIAGYEVAARVGMAVGAAHLLAGWHPTGTHGALGAAAACGSLLGLAPGPLQHALGIAGTQAGGLMASQFGAMVKRFHAGRAAQSGVYAGLLARRGFTGILPLFESEYGGYLTTFSPRSDPAQLTAGLGETWETRAVGFKPYAANGSCHTSIDVLLEMRRQHRFGGDDVERVRVRTSSATREHVGWPYRPDSVTTAQMNLPYIAAATLTDGAAFVDQFTEARIRDERLVALASRVDVTADPGIDARGDASRHAVAVEVVLKDGRVLRDTRDSARGSAASPLSRGEIEAKYATLAGRALPGARVARVQELVYGVDALEDVGVLAAELALGAEGCEGGGRAWS
jgi:2-methylcitrate dehydratase PrpD